MLTYVIGDLFRSPAKVLVNTVNVVGVMGKGIAKDFKLIYPEMFHEYQRLCESKELDIGRLSLHRTPHKWVLNFPTKKHWRNPSKLEYIEAGLTAFVRGYADNSITSVAFPPLGCGNGELDWEHQVRPLMERYLKKLPIEVYIHLYQKSGSSPEHRDLEETKRWLRSEPESLAFSEVWEDICELLDKRNDFVAVETHEPFRVQVTQSPETGLLVETDHSIFVPQDSILDAWQFLRAAGFLTAKGLTGGLDLNANQLFAVLSELPYLKLTQISTRRGDSSEPFCQSVQLMSRISQRPALQPSALQTVLA